MDYTWVQGWTLYKLTLQNLELESNFRIELFPKFEVVEHNFSAEWQREFCALYNNPSHTISFAQKYMYNKKMWFMHVYFHELIHSTTRYTNRVAVNFKLGGPRNYAHLASLEERIADIGGLVLCSIFEKENVDYERVIKKIAEDNKTRFALPWGDLESAVLFYTKNSTMLKAQNALNYMKRLIIDNDLLDIYEGSFNGRENKTKLDVCSNDSNV